MEASGNGFDATDALGNISENSAPSDSGPPMTKEQIAKLTTSLNKMQIESNLKTQRMELKASLSEIGEDMTTPPVTPKKITSQNTIVQPIAKVDENANYAAAKTVKPINVSPEPVKVVQPPPPKKQQNFNPSMRVIQSKSQVIVVHVENHQTLFVIPSLESKDWKELIDRTNKYAKEAEPLKNPPEVGHIVLVKPKTSDAFSRALVKRVRTQDEKAQVEFMEYGFTEITRFSELKCLPDELVNAPRLVNMLTLQGIPDQMDNAQNVVNYLTILQENQTELIIKQLEPIEKSNVSAHFRATLLDAEKFSSINEMIKELNNEKTPKKMEVVEDIPQEPKAANRRVSFFSRIHWNLQEIFYFI